MGVPGCQICEAQLISDSADKDDKDKHDGDMFCNRIGDLEQQNRIEPDCGSRFYTDQDFVS